MTTVFLSYSRRDKAFAAKLNSALEASQLETWIDWDDIPPTADWWEEVERGIERADAFLVLLSPDSVHSDVCAREIHHAVKNAKRLLPLVVRNVDSKDVPTPLSHLNWIFFREEDDFSLSLERLQAAVRLDLGWVETHRRLQVRALEWERSRDHSRLLRGRDLHEAENQLARAENKDPRPTDLQRQYVLRSRRHEVAARNVYLLVAAVLLITFAGLAIFALRQAEIARTEQARAASEANARATAQAIAESQKAEAEEQAIIAYSSRVGAQSQEIASGKSILKLLLALEAVKSASSLDRVPEAATQSLWSALTGMGGTPLLAEGAPVVQILFAKGTHRFVSVASDGSVVLWDADAPVNPISLSIGSQALNGSTISGNRVACALSTSGRWLAAGGSSSILVWDLLAPREKPLLLASLRETDSLVFSSDDRWLMAIDTTASAVKVWDSSDWRAAALILAPPEITGMTEPGKGDSQQFAVLEEVPLSAGFTSGDDDPLFPVTAPGETQSWSLPLIPVTGGADPSADVEAGHRSPTLVKISTDVFGLVFPASADVSPSGYSYERVLAGALRAAFWSDGSLLAANERWVASIVMVDNSLGSSSPALKLIDLSTPDLSTSVLTLAGRRVDTGADISAFSPDGKWLAIPTDLRSGSQTPADFRGTIAILGLQGAGPAAFFSVAPHSTRVSRIVFSPSGKWLASGDIAGEVILSPFSASGYSGDTYRLRGMNGEIASLAFSSDSGWLVAGDTEGGLRMWALSDSYRLSAWPYPLRGGENGVLGLSLGSRDSRLVTLLTDGSLQRWDLTNPGEAPQSLPATDSGGPSVAYHDQGNWIAIANPSGSGLVVEALNPGTSHVLQGSEHREISRVSISPGGAWLLGISERNGDFVCIWETQALTESCRAIRLEGNLKVTDAQVSPNDRWLALLTQDRGNPDKRKLIILDLGETKLEISRPTKEIDGVTAFASSADGRWLATSDSSSKITILAADSLTHKRILTSDASQPRIARLTFSPDGTMLAGYGDPLIHIWDVATMTGKPATILGPIETADFLQFSPDNNWLVARKGYYLFLWNTANYFAPAIVLYRPRGIDDIRFARDGRWMVLKDEHGVVTVFALRASDQIELGCAITGRNFTFLEWLQYFPDQVYRRICPQWPALSQPAAPLPTP